MPLAPARRPDRVSSIRPEPSVAIQSSRSVRSTRLSTWVRAPSRPSMLLEERYRPLVRT
ncbi:hypothetical protein [Actinophytocola sp.]|uniref:hypothetical protein n=1 Tax=Actinophytocola sp. TaxID=1872138 RepID=UPI0025C1D655|nr:hypothetical protein [Actinophytocola sp.]